MKDVASAFSPAEPLDMVLHCPACGLQHIDAPEEHHDRRWLYSWENPPHRSHLCHGCGHVWRPADVPTNGVRMVKTAGKADSPIIQPLPKRPHAAGGEMNLTAREWENLAGVLALPHVADLLIARAQLTPYEHLSGYMNRWWLFNRFDLPGGPQYPELPSVRVHHILRPDAEPHPHNHPWDARTVILKGWYREERDDGFHTRLEGETATITADIFHRIIGVMPGGAWTLVITGPKVSSWGFRTDEGVVPWREYLGVTE